MSAVLFAALSVLLIVGVAGGEVTCRDEQGAAVDWFAIYKLPHLPQSTNPLIAAGLAYIYITSTSRDSEWTLSDKSINDSTSLPGRTLETMYEDENNSSIWLLYNDQPPSLPVSFTHGHTKGCILSDARAAFWLVHSVPHFPPPQNESYGYPSTGQHYGQTMLCVSLPADQLDNVGLQLSYNNPRVFSMNIPVTLTEQLPHLTAVTRGDHVVNPPFFRQTSVTSRAGQTFQSFAKTAMFGKDLYSDWVSPSLETSLLVESWPNGPGRLPSACHRNFRVENVLGMNISAGGEVATFRDQQDHSKWAVTSRNDHVTSDYDVSSNWICIGDINRMTSQESRGGGTLCLDHAPLSNVFRSAVIKTEKCGAYNNVL